MESSFRLAVLLAAASCLVSQSSCCSPGRGGIRRRGARKLTPLVYKQHVTYKHMYLGNILFNGRLVKASANYGCFMSINTTSPTAANLTDNMRVSGWRGAGGMLSVCLSRLGIGEG